MNNLFKKRWDLIILFLFIVGAFFIRSYEFNNFLLFRSDQERDARIAKIAIENGPQYLRLLGPKISKVKIVGDTNPDTSNLGPYYYYCQYLFSLIFSSTEPWVFALPDFILSLFSISIFYFLLREFFSKKISLVTSLIFSFSFVLLQYSRFAWNPNQIVFWSLLFLLSVYKTVIENSKKKKIIWFLLSFLAVLILSQLHVMALFGFPVIMLIFWIIKKPKINWKYWLIALSIIFIFYSPVIISDYVNKGDNTKRFIALFFQEGDKKNIAENFLEAGKNYGMFFSLAITTFNEKKTGSFESGAIIFIISSLVLLFFKFFQSKKNSHEKIFLLLLLIYFFVFFLIYVKTAERIYRPRYWMSLACLPYIFLALWFSLLEKIKKLGLAIVYFLSGVLIISNLYAIFWFYKSLGAGEKIEMLGREETLIRPYREMISYKQMKNTVDFMAKKAKLKENQLCFYYESAQFKNSMEYLLTNYYPEINFINSREVEEIEKYDCVIFAITDYNDNQKEMEKKFTNNFILEKTYLVKPLKIWQFENKIKKESTLKINSPESNIRNNLENKKIYYWVEIFNKK